MANIQNSIETLNQKVTEAYSKILTLNKELEAARKTNSELSATNKKLQEEIASLKSEKEKMKAKS